MGILLQVLVLMLIVTAGFFGLNANFLQQKNSHLSSLASLDRDNFSSSLKKLLGETQSCIVALSQVNLNPSAPATISNLSLNAIGMGGLSELLYQVGSRRGSVEITALSISYEACTLAPCSINGVTYSHQGTLNYNLIATTGQNKRVNGSIGPIYFSPIPGFGVSSCIFTQAAGTTTTSAGAVDCAGLGATSTIVTPTSGPPFTRCIFSQRILNQFGIPTGGATGSIAEDLSASFSWSIGDLFRGRGCSDYRAVTNFSAGPPVTLQCGAVAAAEGNSALGCDIVSGLQAPFCYLDATAPSPLTLLPYTQLGFDATNCPASDPIPLLRYRQGQLIERMCQSIAPTTAQTCNTSNTPLTNSCDRKRKTLP